jgi:hypothetical protein
MILSDFLISIADKALSEPRRFLQPGHNGPYNDSETPVRNYGHWLITFSKCFELTGEKIYFEKIEELAEYLISDDARPHGFSFHHRSIEGKDKCNGLVGQAWTFEALAEASAVIRDIKYVEIAEEVFFDHKFNTEFGLWHRLEIDGNILSIDDTFNHQLWFAACASLLNTPRREEIRGRIFRFMECLPKNLSVFDSGLIYHPIERNLNNIGFGIPKKLKLDKSVKSLLSLLSKRKGQANHKQQREKMIHKSLGYHQFNMYAFGMLKESLPDHPFWQSFEFQQSINYLVSDEFKNGVSKNIYGFPYNPPGFEVPYALSVLSDLTSDDIIEISSWWVNEQLKRCYNPKTQMMDRNTEDPLTHTARVYELTRLPELYLDKIEIAI